MEWVEDTSSHGADADTETTTRKVSNCEQGFLQNTPSHPHLGSGFSTISKDMTLWGLCPSRNLVLIAWCGLGDGKKYTAVWKRLSVNVLLILNLEYTGIEVAKKAKAAVTLTLPRYQIWQVKVCSVLYVVSIIF